MEKVVQANVKAQANENAKAKDAAKTEEFKAKKAAAAKAFAERQKERKAAIIELAKDVVASKVIDKLKPENQKLINDILNPAKSSGGFGGQSFFNKVFGATPKVGDSVKLFDYMQKTLEGKAKLDKYVKEWAEKGIVVEVKPAADIRETLYIIKKM